MKLEMTSSSEISSITNSSDLNNILLKIDTELKSDEDNP
jgi:hypothetical protein